MRMDSEMIREEIRKNEAWALELRREIHSRPELGDQEKETTALIRRELGKMGAVILDAGLETGVLAEIRGTAVRESAEGNDRGLLKTAAVRADIDALPIQEATGLPFASCIPGISHSCGHDLHAAALLLTAKVLSAHRDCFSGTMRMMFQPAEEKGTGALTMIRCGALKDPKPDLVLGFHTWPDTPAGSIGIRRGTSHASSDTFEITVKGKGGHGAHPYRCVDPIVAASSLVLQLQTVISRELPMSEGAVLTVGQISGGTAPNVIPEKVVLRGTLRTLDPVWREKIKVSVKRITELCCASLQAEGTLVFAEDCMPVLLNDLKTADEIIHAGKEILGEDRVMLLPSASPGSDDFAWYLQEVPGALFRIGTGNEEPASHIGLHNGRNLFDERAIAAGASVLCRFLTDYLL